jgi:hypothetical protein
MHSDLSVGGTISCTGQLQGGIGLTSRIVPIRNVGYSDLSLGESLSLANLMQGSGSTYNSIGHGKHLDYNNRSGDNFNIKGIRLGWKVAFIGGHHGTIRMNINELYYRNSTVTLKHQVSITNHDLSRGFSTVLSPTFNFTNYDVPGISLAYVGGTYSGNSNIQIRISDIWLEFV